MENKTVQSQGQTIKCPKCKEDVQQGAALCKHCGSKIISKSRKNIGVGCLVLLAFILVIIAIGSFSGNDSSSNKSSSSQENLQTPESKVKKAVGDIIKPENLKSATYSADTKTVKVEYNPHSKIGDTSYAMISSDSFVREIYTNLVKIGKGVFQVENVEKLNIVAYVDFMDNYGKSKEEKGGEILFSKEEFNKFQWDNLKYQPISKEIKQTALDYYIHPAIAKEINEKDLFLSF